MLLDVLGQMATPIYQTGTTLEQVLIQAASLGLTHFPDGASDGHLGVIASHLTNSALPSADRPGRATARAAGPDHRRQQISQATEQGKPVPPGAPAALYSSILAAFKSLSAATSPGTSTRCWS